MVTKTWLTLSLRYETDELKVVHQMSLTIIMCSGFHTGF